MAVIVILKADEMTEVLIETSSSSFVEISEVLMDASSSSFVLVSDASLSSATDKSWVPGVIDSRLQSETMQVSKLPRLSC